jgi:hypothetical protein
VYDLEQQENTRHRDQDQPRQLLGAFTKLLPQAATQPHAELRRDECLNTDPEHRHREGDAGDRDKVWEVTPPAPGCRPCDRTSGTSGGRRP